MDIAVIQADPEFRKRVLALLLQSDWVQHYGPIIKPEFFDSNDEQAIVNAANDFCGKYHRTPDQVELHSLLSSNVLIDEIYNIDTSCLQYVADVSLDFCKVQAMKLAILQSVDDIKKGDLEAPIRRTKEALQVGTDLYDLGTDVIADAKDWVYGELHGFRYPTGWMQVNQWLEGGMSGGEQGIILAPTGAGKTTALINIGYALAGLICGVNVLHIGLESSKQRVLARYAARITGVRLSRTDESITEKQFIELLSKKGKQTLRGRLRVQFPQDRTLSGIRRTIDSCNDSGFVVGALIVDYMALLDPPVRRKERRFELEDLSRGLTGLGVDYSMPVWTGAQAGRQALSKAIISTEDIAEAISVAGVADTILAICQTKDERQIGRGRIYGAKVRSGEGGHEAPVKIDFTKQLIVDDMGLKR